ASKSPARGPKVRRFRACKAFLSLGSFLSNSFETADFPAPATRAGRIKRGINNLRILKQPTNHLKPGRSADVVLFLRAGLSVHNIIRLSPAKPVCRGSRCLGRRIFL